MALEKYINIIVFLLSMKYVQYFGMLNEDFLAEDMLIWPILIGVYLRKCLIFYDYEWFG